MSLSGNQTTGVGPIQSRRAYGVFTAKETVVSTAIAQITFAGSQKSITFSAKQRSNRSA